MTRTRKRDLTVEEQLARGPIDLPFLMLVVMLTAIGVVMVFSASYPTAINEGKDPANYFIRQAGFGAGGLLAMYFISKINYQRFRWMSVGVLIASYALKINEVLSDYLKDVNIELIDFKLEFGKTSDGKIVLADEISPDTCRFWDSVTKEKLDKDRFRRDLGGVENAYHEVLKRLLGE